MNTILILDDDPSHLKIYSWILEREGYQPVTALVGTRGAELPENLHVDAVLLDYRLASELTAVDIAKRLKQVFPAAPVVILSEMPWMPDDIAPHAAAFVHKGEPQQLLDALRVILAEPRAFVENHSDLTTKR